MTKSIFMVLALIGFISFTAKTLAETEKIARQDANITAAKDSEKIPLIIAFLQDNVHFMQDKSLAYSHQALAILSQFPNPAYESQILSYMATANMYLGKSDLATEQVDKALQLAHSINNRQHLLLAYKTKGRIQAGLHRYQAALEEFEKAYDIAIATDDKKNQAGLLRLMAYEYRNLTRYDKSLELHLRSGEIYHQLGERKESAHQKANAGTIYRIIGDWETALDYLQESLKVMQDLNDLQALAILYNNTALIYQNIEDYDRAIDMYSKSLAIKELLGYRRGKLFTLINLGNTYRLAGKDIPALEKLYSALSLAKEINHPVREGITQLHLGQIYSRQLKFLQAEEHFSVALKVFTKIGSNRRLAEVMLAKGKMSQQQEKSDQAIRDLQQSIEYARQSQFSPVLLEAYQEISKTYEQLAQYRSALIASRDYQALVEKIASQKSQQRIDILRVGFDLDQKQRQIELLTQKNKVSALEISNQIAKRNSYLIGLFLAFSLVAFIYYRFNTNKQFAIERKALNEIKIVKERLKLALWGSGDELWDWNLINHQVTRINHTQNVALPVHYPDNDFSLLKEIVHPDDYEQLSHLLAQYILDHQGYYQACYRVKCQNGDWMWLLDRGKAVEFDAQGNVTRITGTLRDISELKSHEQALIKLNEELELRVNERTSALKSSNQALQDKIKELKTLQLSLVEIEKMASLGRVVSGIAHEINTPIGITITAVSVLKELTENFNDRFITQKLTRSEMKSFVQNLQSSCELIENNVARSSALIQTFKQVAVDQSSESAKRFDLEENIKRAFTGFSSQLTLGQHSYTITCPDTITMFSYPDSLIQVMEILIENSIFHGFEDSQHGNITLALKQNQNRVFIDYRDNGQGIGQENIEHLFEPFHTTKRNKNFTGLGLHIAYNQVTQRLKGSIVYCSTPGETGTGFTICIPADINQ
ncbi:tetratricopeptide repeat protein [Thalassomonas haliotis]|uniref:histidine kinase n=1 Tax=Thalassomonas haliotis TaxID=485448 RepID=A0ABY7VJS8_9GAMM|nr:tetratricopeptide repeat protein [Thalassomonas haliotis]WDE13642.1 tetratricopeptide repeat protein [Thalassomonas haliotis]